MHWWVPDTRGDRVENNRKLICREKIFETAAIIVFSSIDVNVFQIRSSALPCARVYTTPAITCLTGANQRSYILLESYTRWGSKSLCHEILMHDIFWKYPNHSKCFWRTLVMKIQIKFGNGGDRSMDSKEFPRISEMLRFAKSLICCVLLWFSLPARLHQRLISKMIFGLASTLKHWSEYTQSFNYGFDFFHTCSGFRMRHADYFELFFHERRPIWKILGNTCRCGKARSRTKNNSENGRASSLWQNRRIFRRKRLFSERSQRGVVSRRLFGICAFCTGVLSIRRVNLEDPAWASCSSP